MSSFSDSLSRRDFLKLAGLSIASFLTPLDWTEAHAAQGLFPAQDGRVARKTTQLIENPGFDSEPLKEHWRDIILPITGIAISEDDTAYTASGTKSARRDSPTPATSNPCRRG